MGDWENGAKGDDVRRDGKGLGGATYVGRGRVALEVGFDGAVLLVEERHIRDEVLDDVHVGKGVDAGLLGGIGGDAACLPLAHLSSIHPSYPFLSHYPSSLPLGLTYTSKPAY